MITCSFCGYTFNENEANKPCPGCPMNKNCGYVPCPNCNFMNVKPLLFKWNWFKKKHSCTNKPTYDQKICKLIDLKPGQQGEIIKINISNIDFKKLTIFNIIPGEIVSLIQKKPCYIIKIGNTQVALDKKIADGIIVKRI